jgi:hypothetical protein
MLHPLDDDVTPSIQLFESMCGGCYPIRAGICYGDIVAEANAARLRFGRSLPPYQELRPTSLRPNVTRTFYATDCQLGRSVQTLSTEAW